MEWATLPLQKYADFTGRSRRKEYWSFFLLYLAVMIVASIIDAMLGFGSLLFLYGPLATLAVLALIVPSLAVGARRLHDTGRSGWWLLIAFVPLIGGIVLLVFFATEGMRGDNLYGPDPMAGEARAIGARA
jgi:uncharacterized membrane protein YhaH (DUF805 family)